MAETPLTPPQSDEAAQKAAQNAFQDIDAETGTVIPPDKPEVPTPQPETPKPEEKPEDKPADPPKDETPPTRPERYIPVGKYQDERKQWTEKNAALEAEIAKLRTAQDTATTPAQVTAAEDKIAAWAEKRGMDYEAAKELIDIAREGMGIPKETLAAVQAVETQRREQESQAKFSNEFTTGVVPLIREAFPEASEQQIAEAKKLMDELAHTQALAQTPLAYIFHGNRTDFAELFTDKPGFERSKPTSSTAIKGAHFKGKKDFAAVMALDEDDQARVVSEMDTNTRWDYYDYVEKQDNKLEVKREGRTIKLR